MTEKILNNKKNGMSMLIVCIALYLAALALVIFSGVQIGDGRLAFIAPLVLSR